jgi:site-specific recombinase XerD
MRIVQSILSFAITEELVDFNAMAAVRKPRYERAREPRIFRPGEVEQIRANLKRQRDRTLVSVLPTRGRGLRRSSAASPGTIS